jgi:nitroreductase
MILQAGLLSASGKGARPWELIVVRDREMIKNLSLSRDNSSNQRMTAEADTAVVVICDSEKSDTWVEDGAIVLTNMHLMADALGLGSCWLQGHLRTAADGQSSDDYIRGLLNYPEKYKLVASLLIGVPSEHAAPYELENLPAEKIHYEKY